MGWPGAAAPLDTGPWRGGAFPGGRVYGIRGPRLCWMDIYCHMGHWETMYDILTTTSDNHNYIDLKAELYSSFNTLDRNRLVFK
jgi:hypothetical protein